MREMTLSILKPDAVRRNITGAINSYFEKAGLSIVAQKRIKLPYEQAEAFYAVHKERPFFQSLCKSISSGPVVVQVLSGDGVIALNRKIMGATDPANADHGTIRKDFALSIEENSVHGSDSPENAAKEIQFFFSEIEIIP
ncbi:MAG: nucleoside-diphosphate kinase [Holosporales bacterium]|nr:nucleoside-diphosphate kinase [Holosporales bacterium]